MTQAVAPRTADTSASYAAVAGAIGGIVATAAMTIVMDVMHRRLPPTQRYPLPPRELTERVFERTGIEKPRDESALRAASLATHAAFGAAAGALYGPLLAGRGAPPLSSGVVYALTVWAASYLGWVPAARLLRPATDHPAARNALMVAAHVVWGAALGAVTSRLLRAAAPLRQGTLDDAP